MPQETTDLPDWVEQYTIDGHTFRGLVCFDPHFEAFYLNLNPDAAEALDLRAEMRDFVHRQSQEDDAQHLPRSVPGGTP